jgi:hypothetical protein
MLRIWILSKNNCDSVENSDWGKIAIHYFGKFHISIYNGITTINNTI